MLPLLAGVAPFGFAIGATVAARDVPLVAGWSTSPLLFAGSAQMSAIELIDSGATVLVVVATVVAVNARLALLAAGLAPHWRDASPRWRALASAFIVEPLYVLVADRYERDGSPEDKRAFYEGAAATLWVGWSVATALGIAVGGRVPDALALDAVMPITLVGLLVPMLRDRATVVAAVVAAAVAYVAFGAPQRSGVLVASLAGVLAASAAKSERRR
jgi:predicted branched-subunit amino acid permease